MTSTVALTPRKAMFRSLLWSVISAGWLLIAAMKLHRLQSAGGFVNPFRYGVVIFWTAVLAIWIVMAWRDCRQMRLGAVGKVS